MILNSCYRALSMQIGSIHVLQQMIRPAVDGERRSGEEVLSKILLIYHFGGVQVAAGKNILFTFLLCVKAYLPEIEALIHQHFCLQRKVLLGKNFIITSSSLGCM